MGSGGSSCLRRVIASLVFVAMTAAMAACGGSTTPTSNSTSTARQSTKMATQTGGGPAPSATGHPRDTPASGARDLPCDEFIATQPPAHDMRVVLGVVALPRSPHSRRALQTARSDLTIRRRACLASRDWTSAPALGFALSSQARFATSSRSAGATPARAIVAPRSGWMAAQTAGREVARVRRRLLRPRSLLRAADRRRTPAAKTSADRRGQGVPRATPTAPADTAVNDPSHRPCQFTPRRRAEHEHDSAFVKSMTLPASSFVAS